jgi:hypothetical protein
VWLSLEGSEQLQLVLSSVSTPRFHQNSVMQCIIACPQLAKFQLGRRQLGELNTLCHSMVVSLANTVRVEATCQPIQSISGHGITRLSFVSQWALNTVSLCHQHFFFLATIFLLTVTGNLND